MPPSCYVVQVCSNYANRNAATSLHLSLREIKIELFRTFDLSTRIELISTQWGASLFFQRILSIFTVFLKASPKVLETENNA